MSEANQAVPPPTPEHRRFAAASLERANRVALAGDYDLAWQLLARCCQIDPGNLIYRQALRRVVVSAHRKNAYGLWRTYFQRWMYRAKLRGAERRSDWLGVLAYGEQVLRFDPWHDDTLRALAAATQALGYLDVAVWYLEEARSAPTDDPALARPLARLYEKRGNLTEALALWRLLLEVVPGDDEARAKLASGWPGLPAPGHNRGETADDLARLQELIRQEPRAIQSYLDLADLHRQAGRLDEARAVLRHGLAPTGQAFALSHALVDLEIEPFRRNLALVEHALQAHPDRGDLRATYGQLFKEVNTRDIEWYRQRADRFPQDYATRLELGIRLFRAGQLDEAVAELEQASNSPECRVQSLIHLGHCHLRARHWPRAEACYEEALQLVSPPAVDQRKELLYILALAAARAHNLDKALAHADALLELDPNYREIGPLRETWQAAKTN